VLGTTGRQELDLIETLGQRQCSAPGFRDKSSRERQRVRIY